MGSTHRSITIQIIFTKFPNVWFYVIFVNLKICWYSNISWKSDWCIFSSYDILWQGGPNDPVDVVTLRIAVRATVMMLNRKQP